MALAPCVNDYPYVALSVFAVALGQAFSTILSGHAKDRPERVGERWPLTLRLPVVDCDGGARLAAHPKQETIMRRYLRYKRRFVGDALKQLAQSVHVCTVGHRRAGRCAGAVVAEGRV